MRREKRGAVDAEAIAIGALGHIAADPDTLGRFLALTGLGPETLRRAAADPAFLARVLDYVAEDEKLLLAYASASGHAPESILAAHHALGGRRPE
jgi:hypothetical protein